MRILLVSQMYPGPADPDLGSFVAQMEQALRERGHEIELAVLDRRGGGKRRFLELRRRVRAAAPPDVVWAHFLVPAGLFTDLVRFNPNDRISQSLRSPDEDDALHSVSVRFDGRRAFLAYLGSGMLVLDTSQIAAAVAHPQVALITDPAKRPSWGNPGDHSEVKIPGRPYTLSTTEVYGTFTDPQDHCPWGWVRLIDIRDETAPKVVGQFKTSHNDPTKCMSYSASTLARSSYASHNPTVIGGKLALVTWHSDGLQAIDISDPTHPVTAGAFLPKSLATVATEDPALGGGDSHVQAWSYPVVSDGLVYMVDIRNGLYVLRYHGRHGNPLNGIQLLEGNDNFGDATRFGN